MGVIKRKNFTRCQQLVLENNQLMALSILIFYLGDKKLEIYDILSDQKVKLRQKRMQSRKKQKESNEIIDIEEEEKVNVYELQVSAGE